MDGALDLEYLEGKSKVIWVDGLRRRPPKYTTIFSLPIKVLKAFLSIYI